MKEQPSDTEGFLGRWARLKQESRQTVDDVPEPADLPEPVSSDTPLPQETTDTPPPETISEPRILTDEDMPPIETLDEHSDYKGFMSSGVSEELRRLALRKLFAVPHFNTRDGLDSYDDDYTGFATLDPGVVTSDMKHMMEVEARRALEALDKLTRQAPAAATDPDTPTTEIPDEAEPTATTPEDSNTPSDPATETNTAIPPASDSHNTEEQPL